MYYKVFLLSSQLLILIVYLIFYNRDIFLIQLKWFLPIIACYALGVITKLNVIVIFTLIGLWVTYIFQKKLNKYMLIILLALSGAVMGISLTYSSLAVITSVILLLFDLFVILAENRRIKSLNSMQDQYLVYHYEEIKNIYLNMRGWKHDYHNHIQVMKAYIAMEQNNELKEYISKLECDLNSVDMLVKSGNIMMDAILNSKISIMLKHHIKVDAKVVLPEVLAIKDIDMCVMVSNLLENAIEACLNITIANRFIRIYAEVFGSQFYLSIQNSAEEELNFNQKNYISTKRGEHGLGMKRVQYIVDKHSGFLNLQNEPGIFASEVTIPL